jgi:NDP-sugar pyrophosphorylase family protein
MSAIVISRHVSAWAASPFAAIELPWVATQGAEELIRAAIPGLGDEYRFEDGIAVHHLARIEDGAVIKGPAIIGPGCFVAANAYLRGGVYLQRDCIVGPAAELKTSFMFEGSKLAHLNFVGDSILGAKANVEAGAMIANYRNERDDKRIRIRFDGGMIETGVDKFGALVGDESRIGANAVIAPGAILAPGSRIGRLELVDQGA